MSGSFTHFRLLKLASALGVLAAAAAVLTGPALAGSVSVSGARLTYQAGAAETNDVTIVMSQDRETWTVTDTGAPLTAGAGCASADTHTATCAVPRPLGNDSVRILLHDRADTARSAESCWGLDDGQNHGWCQIYVRGGSGDDELVGNSFCPPPQFFVQGGPGDDRIIGSGSLSGGVGSDRLTGSCIARLDGGRGADTLDGNNDHVTAVYSTRNRPVSVTLDGRRNDGEKHERDLVVRVPEVEGGAADDIIVGDSAHNYLVGGSGNDLIRGGATRDILRGDSEGCSRDDDMPGGADRIFGGHGGDSLNGCGGDDVIRAGSSRDFLSGSNGTDRIFAGGGNDHASGGRGGDTLVGGLGRDELSGGRGRDGFRARDGVADTLAGGPGRDRASRDVRLDRTTSIERFE
jgi:Ca2+-binding RTX toxin-like protein